MKFKLNPNTCTGNPAGWVYDAIESGEIVGRICWRSVTQDFIFGPMPGKAIWLGQMQEIIDQFSLQKQFLKELRPLLKEKSRLIKAATKKLNKRRAS